MKYWDLENYLRVPRTMLLGRLGMSTRWMSFDQSLVVRRVKGERFDSALFNAPDKFSQATHAFIVDLERMWRETASPVATNPTFSEQLKQEMRGEPLDTILAFIGSPET